MSGKTRNRLGRPGNLLSVEFAILGPVEVQLDGNPVALGGPKPRALLAMLLLEANNVVSRDRLIEGLWGERLPPTAEHTLDDYISRLRKALGTDRIERRPPGYSVRVETSELDLARFDNLLEEGREQLTRSDAAAAAATLRDALGLWRGPALADVLNEPFASVEADRLEGKRLSALEDRIEADLALGGGSELVAELEALARQHPFRERLLGHLMLALYRCGRQAEALERFRTARHRLADELGLEPGMQLRQLEGQILDHDPVLGAPRPPVHSLRVGRRSRRFAAIATAIIAVGVTIGVVLGINRTDAAQAPAVVRDALAVVDASSGRLEPGIEFAGSPAAIAADPSSLWVADSDEGAVSRVSLSSGAVEDRIPIAGQPGAVAVGDGSVWVATTVGGTVIRIDPVTGTVTQTIPLGGTPAAIAFGTNSVWVADPADDALLRIEPRTGIVASTLELPSRPSALAVGLGGVWVASHDASTVAHVDPASNKVLASVNVGQGPAAVAMGAGSVWVANALDGTVSRLEPRTGRVVATIAVGSGPVALAFDGGAIWVASEVSRTVSRIDPVSNTVTRTLPVSGRRPAAVAAAGDRVWIGTRSSGDDHRGGTLRLLGYAPPSVDPAFNMQWYPPPSFLGLAYDTLVTFERASGPDGLHLVPDLAVALPTPTSAGTTYTFRLRPGIRYSNGAALKASDVRRGLERLFRVGSPGAGFYASIVGGKQCASHTESCDLSRGIVADDTTRTVVFRLAKPDPELLFKLALGYAVPVPVGMPSRDVGFRPIPGTGPYRIEWATWQETRFVRNGTFREWSRAAQPDGNPDVIVWRYGLSPTAQARAVVASRADFMSQQIPPPFLANIRIHRPGQLRVNPVLGIEFLTINNRLPPFDRTAVRQALNYAIDRREVVRLYGGPSTAKPTCQVLPPGIPGYRPYCPYTLHARADSGWAAPDPAKAKQLVAASGTAGARVNVGVFADESEFQKRVVRYVAGVLRSLGYRARVQNLSRADFSPEQQRAIHLMPSTWYADYPAPADFLGILFDCEGGLSDGGFCDAAIDRLMQRALRLALTDAQRAAAAWAEVDHRVVDAAASVPLINPRAVEFVSSRVRNYQYHPVWGLLAAQVWLQ